MVTTRPMRLLGLKGCGSGRMGRGPSSRGVVLVEWGVVNFQLGVWLNRVIMIIMISLNKFKDLRTSRDMSCTTCTLYEVYTVQCTLYTLYYSTVTVHCTVCYVQSLSIYNALKLQSV